MKSRWMKPMVTLCVLALGLAFAAAPASAGHVLELQVIGRGTSTGAVVDCVTSLVAGCSLETSGEIMGIHLGHGRFTLQIRTGATPEVNSEGGICLPANRSETTSQTATLTAANGDIIRFNTVGKLCEELGALSSLQFIADYRIAGGSGRFDDVVGGGNLALTVDRTNTPARGDTFLFMHGPIRY